MRVIIDPVVVGYLGIACMYEAVYIDMAGSVCAGCLHC